ncbi:hypothetical protein EV360DRAFT_54739 [Lentinula raphanica]|nr:hypothetical protein EV360DRAFT_54739 [Lentinula raphanica]
MDSLFDFLPDDDDTPTSVPGSSHTTAPTAPTAPLPHHIHRPLVEDEEDEEDEEGGKDKCLWHSTAGEVIRVDRDVQQRWNGISSRKEETADAECYSPFSSRTEWEIAQWAVKDRISQGSFNRLLQIPQVIFCLISFMKPSILMFHSQVKEKLGVTFNNAKSMLGKLDDIPERCGPWFTKKLTFKDRSDEEYLIYHRDPIEAIKSLWGDPALASDLVYRAQASETLSKFQT